MMTTQPIRLASFTFALSCITVLIASSLVCGQSSSLEFPYQALVAKDNALVRSGPGEVHYGTQKLPAGQVVEVYRHDPDGWCAIRPVEGSFDIIPESTIEIISEGVGEVKLSGTTPFVGTKLGTVEKPLWQVKLREKEKVSLIGQLSWPNPEGHSTIWYQIKPPAGEFRWINISDLESLAGETMASVIRPKPAKEALPPEPIQPVAKLPTAKSAIATPRPTADLARQPNVAPARPNVAAAEPKVDSATARRQPAQPRDQPAESNRFVHDQSEVQLAGFASSAAAAPTPIAAKPTAPPLQDSGSGWRRATRAIPSNEVSTSSNAGFTQYEMPIDNRSQFDSSSIDNSRFASQNQQNYNQTQSRQNQANESYDLNSVNRQQPSFAGQIRVADAGTDRNRFAQQLNQSRDFSQTYTSQASTPNALQSLNNQLTKEMLKAPSAWQLAPLEAATRQYLSTTGNYGEQQAGMQFLAKLENCRRVAAGYGSAGGLANGSGLSNSSGFPNGNASSNGNGFSNGQPGYGSGNPASYVATNANVGSNTLGANNQNNSQFDATGWLNELKRGRGTDPSTYVLQDASGKIIYHVTPMPGLNLSRYLKKRVGVNGQLGFNQKLNLRHVTIQRVYPL